MSVAEAAYELRVPEVASRLPEKGVMAPVTVIVRL